MERNVRTILIVVTLIVSSTVASGVVGAATESPTIAVEVNGDRLADGGRVVVPEATLTVRVEGDENLSSVVVRINGEDVGQFYPDGTTFGRTFDSDLHGGDNEIRVIATDESDQTNSYRATVHHDSIAPFIGLHEPFTVKPGYAFPDNETIDAVNVTLNGTVHDESNITDFEARIEGNGTVQTTALANDSSFALNTTLGLGNSTLTIRSADEYGNERQVQTRMVVEDDADPSIEISGWRNESRRPVTVQVRATDDVGLRSLTVDAERQPERDLLEPSTELFDAGRHDVTLNTTLEFRFESVYNVTFTATDVANNTVDVTKKIEYDPITEAEAAAPDIGVERNESGIVKDGSYLLRAVVSNGSVSRVTVESETVEGGNVTGHSVVYDGPERANVTIYERVAIEPGRNDVQIRATDSFGVQHERTIRVDTKNESHWLAKSGPPTTNESTTSPKTVTTTPIVPAATAEQEEPLTPVTETSVPLSPAPIIVAIVLVALGLGRRSKSE